MGRAAAYRMFTGAHVEVLVIAGRHGSCANGSGEQILVITLGCPPPRRLVSHRHALPWVVMQSGLPKSQLSCEPFFT
jgi:hypothetical protein